MQRLKGRRCAGIRAVCAGGGSGRVTAGARGERGRSGARPAVTVPGAGGGSPGSPKDKVVGGPFPAVVVAASLHRGRPGGGGGRGRGRWQPRPAGGSPGVPLVAQRRESVNNNSEAVTDAPNYGPRKGKARR